MHICRSSQAAQAPEGAGRAGRCLCTTTVCHLWKALEMRGGPSDSKKANGTPGFKKFWKDPYAIQRGQVPSAASEKD